MNIFSIFVLSSILAGVSYASDPLIKGSDAIADQSFIKLDGSDITLTEVKVPAAKANAVERILPASFPGDDVYVDIDVDEFDNEDGHESLGEQVDGNNLNEKNGDDNLGEKNGYDVHDGNAEVFEPFKPLPIDVAYNLYAGVRSVTHKIHAVFAKPQDLPSLKEAQHAWDLLKQKLAILTPENAAAADLDNLKALELKITEQLSSVSIESVHQLKLDWADMKKLLDDIVRVQWNIMAGRAVGPVKKKSLLGQLLGWLSGSASSDNKGARRLLGFLE